MSLPDKALPCARTVIRQRAPLRSRRYQFLPSGDRQDGIELLLKAIRFGVRTSAAARCKKMHGNPPGKRYAPARRRDRKSVSTAARNCPSLSRVREANLPRRVRQSRLRREKWREIYLRVRYPQTHRSRSSQR